VSTLIWTISYLAVCTFAFFVLKIAFVDTLHRFRYLGLERDEFIRSRTAQDKRIILCILFIVVFIGGGITQHLLKQSYERDTARFQEIRQQVQASGLNVNNVGLDGYGADEVKLTLGNCHPTFEVHRNNQGLWQLATPVTVSYAGTVYNEVTDNYDPATLQKRVGFGFVTPEQIKLEYKACLTSS
jgi:hypothetical protein